MASEGTNHLITLFLISNCFCGFGFGVLVFGAGVGTAVIGGAAAAGYDHIVGIVVGLVITFWSLVGCFGAITQNKKNLSAYISGMTILSILEIVHLAKFDHGELQNKVDELTTFYAFMIFLIIFTLVTILLAITISCRIVSGEIGDKIRQQQQRGLGAA